MSPPKSFNFSPKGGRAHEGFVRVAKTNFEFVKLDRHYACVRFGARVWAMIAFGLAGVDDVGFWHSRSRSGSRLGWMIWRWLAVVGRLVVWDSRSGLRSRSWAPVSSCSTPGWAH